MATHKDRPLYPNDPESCSVKGYKNKKELVEQIMLGKVRGAWPASKTEIHLNQKAFLNGTFYRTAQALRACGWNCTDFEKNIWEKPE